MVVWSSVNVDFVKHYLQMQKVWLIFDCLNPPSFHFFCSIISTLHSFSNCINTLSEDILLVLMANAGRYMFEFETGQIFMRQPADKIPNVYDHSRKAAISNLLPCLQLSRSHS